MCPLVFIHTSVQPPATQIVFLLIFKCVNAVSQIYVPLYLQINRYTFCETFKWKCFFFLIPCLSCVFFFMLVSRQVCTPASVRF